MKDEDFMQKTFRLALKAKGCTSPNPMVGCVLVKNKRVIAQGFHERAGQPHAEIEALSKAGKESKGSVLYVNLEPCFHWGKTPPCVDALIRAEIKKVVIGVKDPNPLVSGRSITKLKKAGIKVKTGILKPEAKKVNEVFFVNMKEQRPFVVLKAAQTLDGKISDKNGDSKWITSLKARQYARRLRGFYDSVLVGANTVVQDNPFLDSPGKKMVKVILDPDLQISAKHNIFRKAEKVILFVRKGSMYKDKSHYFRAKAEVIGLNYFKNGFRLGSLLDKLYSLGIKSVFVEGGGYTLGKFLESKKADKVYLFVAPKIMGQAGALSAFSGNRDCRLNNSILLKNLRLETIGKDYLFCGYPVFKEDKA
jgi:diaminohydroxyphosphoribosylaminopyrimidine deaminase / 5-amino-6-(5-phosphoribosylamino)uracil reductase